MARDVDRTGIPSDAFFVALDEDDGRGGRVREPDLRGGQHDRRLPRHDRGPAAYRGRGIAGALKRATIAWAVDHGLEALDTGNDESERPDARRERGSATARRPDWIGLQGPLAPPR